MTIWSSVKISKLLKPREENEFPGVITKSAISLLVKMSEQKSAQQKISLISSDNETFEVDRNVIRLSTTINTMLQDLGMDNQDGGDVDMVEGIPLQSVNSAILKKVIHWCEYHKDDPIPPEDNDNKEKRTDDISSWDVEFLKVDQGTLFELILATNKEKINISGKYIKLFQAANYLDIKGLLDVTCKTVANMIKGKSPEEIRRTFNIKNDFTPEEEEQVERI
ncbi:unnamed protein product [Wuchereria bancrofti]|uniref:Skp1-related protein n=1 Tax=Wuchereria bancrofti TaxID=6293 RepID=A0A3P7E4P7_WUCBA|nr:unnamed protein product [Wuchereria bancrofti]